MSALNKLGGPKCTLSREMSDFQREKENMSQRREDEQRTRHISLKTPSPSKADFEEYDNAQRLARQSARDARIEERQTPRTPNKELLTPEIRGNRKSPDSKNSSNNDAYFTPIYSSIDGSFSTPLSSQDSTVVPQQTITPNSRFSHGVNSFEEVYARQKILDDRLDRNFKKMNKEFGSSTSTQREILSPPPKQSKIDLDLPSSSKHSSPSSALIGSAPSPAVTLSGLAKLAPNRSKILIDSMRRQREYAKGATELEKRLDELERLQREMKERQSMRTNKRNRESTTEDTFNTIEKLKDKLAKIVSIKRSIHRLGQNSNFDIGDEDAKRMQMYDEMINLPRGVFREECKKEYNFLSRQMTVWVGKFRAILAMNKETDDENQIMRRTSDVIKISPNLSADTSRNAIVVQKVYLRDVETQVTPRLAEPVEKLDLSKLDKKESQIRELDDILSKIVLKPGKDLDKSLNDTVADESIAGRPTTPDAHETSFRDKIKQFEDVYPKNVSIEAETPRSARSTIDSATARRLSESVSHFLEEYIKTQESPGTSIPTLTKDQSESLSSSKTGSPRDDDVSVRDVAVELEKPKQSDEPSLSVRDDGVKIEEEYIKEEIVTEQDQEFDASKSTPIAEFMTDYNAVMDKKKNEKKEKVFNVHNKPIPIAEFLANYDSIMEQEQNQIEAAQPIQQTGSMPIADFLANYDSIMEQEKKQREELQMQQGSSSSAYNYQNEVEEEEEGDETKKFVTTNEEEFNDDESANSETQKNAFNDSADDSGFLLDDKPFKLPPSILDSLGTDTPRKDILAAVDSFEEVEDQFDVEMFCRSKFIEEIKTPMINALIEKHESLRGCNWIVANSVLPEEMFQLGSEIPDDPFEFFDSFVIRLWGTLVDLLNKRFLRVSIPFDDARRDAFRVEALELIDNEFGMSAMSREFHERIRVPKRIAGFLPHSVDYRYDVRKAMSHEEKMNIMKDQLNATAVYPLYSIDKLEHCMNKIIATDTKYLENKVLAGIREELDGEPEDEVGETSL